jgi:quercetin dioxygenase-like cupin family protein
MSWRTGWSLAAVLVVSFTAGAAAQAAEATSAAEPVKEEQAVMPLTLQKFDEVKVQEFPWGWIRWLINDQVDPAAEMTFGIVYIKPQQTNPLHVHPNSAEYLHVLEGSCEHRVGDRWVTVKAGDTVRIPAGVKHNARTKEEPCRAVIVYNTGKRQMVPVQE